MGPNEKLKSKAVSYINRTFLSINKVYASILIFLLTVFAFCWLFLGVYEEPEWLEKRIFLKHRASFHWYFPAPGGERYPFMESIADLPKGFNDEDVMLYIEFINEGRAYQRSVFFIPSIWF